MPDNRFRLCPRLRHHRGLGMAYVCFALDRKRKYLYFGPWGSAKARAGYAAFRRRWVDVIFGRWEPPQRWPARRLLEHGGKTKSVELWAAEVGIKATTIRYRLDILGWTVPRALTTPTRGKVGGVKGLARLAAERGLKPCTVKYRVHVLKWSLDKALSTPVQPLRTNTEVTAA